jgi:hypothetical protein
MSDHDLPAPTKEAIADQVWDELNTAHTTTGTSGESQGKIMTPRYKALVKCDPRDIKASIAFSNVAADKDFPDIYVPNYTVPSNATIMRVFLWILIRELRDSSGAENYINAALKKIRIKPNSGAWGTDDIVAMILANTDWNTPANQASSGPFIIGSEDLSSIMSDPASINGKIFNVRSEQTTRSDAIVAKAASLTAYGVSDYLQIEYTL